MIDCYSLRSSNDVVRTSLCSCLFSLLWLSKRQQLWNGGSTSKPRHTLLSKGITKYLKGVLSNPVFKRFSSTHYVCCCLSTQPVQLSQNASSLKSILAFDIVSATDLQCRVRVTDRAGVPAPEQPL
jgi:hypothetical protein